MQGKYRTNLKMEIKKLIPNLHILLLQVGNGFDDATMRKLQGELKPIMKSILRDQSSVPDWLDVSRMHTPDFVVHDPTK